MAFGKEVKVIRDNRNNKNNKDLILNLDRDQANLDREVLVMLNNNNNKFFFLYL